MDWINSKERSPTKKGKYLVVESFEGVRYLGVREHEGNNKEEEKHTPPEYWLEGFDAADIPDYFELEPK